MIRKEYTTRKEVEAPRITQNPEKMEGRKTWRKEEPL
jgi:hypothetical protein